MAAAVRFQIGTGSHYSLQEQGQALLKQAASLSGRACKLLIRLNTRTCHEPAASTLGGDAGPFEADLSLFLTSAQLVDDPEVKVLVERLQAAHHNATSALSRFRAIQPVFMSLSDIERKWDAYCTVFDEIPATEIPVEKVRASFLKFRELFAAVDIRIQEAAPFILANPRAEFNRLFAPYKRCDDVLVSQGILSRLP